MFFATAEKDIMTQALAEAETRLEDDRVEYELIELLFFAYRDFVAEPDRILTRYGFGRAHHRVLHFVNRNPGLTIAALLEILQITKQSLSRVLKDLIEGGFIEQRAGSEDRRQRLLFVTRLGAALAGEMAQRQSDRIGRALESAGPRGREVAERFLAALIDAQQRGKVASLIGLPGKARP
jgi:DNA-binding MarR family transcriptional regulator